MADETVNVTISDVNPEIVYVTLEEFIPEIVEVTVNNLRGPTGLTGPVSLGGYIYVQDETSPPGAPSLGETWFAPDTSKAFVWDGSVWIETASSDTVLNSDTSTLSMGFVIDEDNMGSNSPTKIPTQQSVRAFVLAQIDGVEGGTGGGGYTYVQDETNPPTFPLVGDTWFAPDTNNSYLRYNDTVSVVWVQTNGSSGSGTSGGGYVYVQDETQLPVAPLLGEEWFAPDTGNSYLRYNDGSIDLWVQTAGPGSFVGPIVGGNAANP